MRADYFDKKMRAFEEANDPHLIPEMFVLARIDGRNFGRLARKELKVPPFDIGMRDAMLSTTKHVMDSGFKSVYGFTQSDEISLLFDKTIHNIYNGKIRKINSILAGEASAKFSMLMNHHGAFDCRTIQIPTIDLVGDYFLWRRADSETNCINGWCYHVLTTKENLTPEMAQKHIDRKDFAFKNELLFRHRINFIDLPNWQKRGIGIYWEQYEKEGYNPISKEKVKVPRNRLNVNFDLPLRPDRYIEIIYKLLQLSKKGQK